MKILLINGSPKAEGNTFLALNEVKKTLVAEGIEAEIIHVGAKPIRGCMACGACNALKECVIHDFVNDVHNRFKEADGMVIASPVYYASPNGTLISFLDRLFFSTKFDKTMKVGASIAVARRGGTTATWDVLNKYFAISGMPIASANYWNNVHGWVPGEAKADAEGLQTMRVLAKNIAFLVKSIQIGKRQFGLPAKEEKVMTSFVR